MTTPSNSIEINDDVSFVLKEVKMIQDSLMRLIDWTCHLQNKINDLHSEYTTKQSKTPLVSSGTKSNGTLRKFHQKSNTTSSSSNHSSRNQKNKTQDKNNRKDSAASIMMVNPSRIDNNNNNKYNHSVTGGGNKRTPLDLVYNKNDEQEMHSCKDGYLESSLLFDDECSTASNDMSILTSSEFSLLPCQQLLHSSTNEKEEDEESSSSSDSHNDRTSTRSRVRSSSKHDIAAETLLRKSIKTTKNYNSNLSGGYGGATSQLFSSPVAIFSSTTRIPSTTTAAATSNYYIHPSHTTYTNKQENKEDSEEHISYDQFKSPALDDISCNDSLYADVDLFDSQKEIQLSSFRSSDKKDIIGAGTLRSNIHTTTTTELYEYSKKKKTGTMPLKHKIMRAKWQLKYVLSKLRKQQL